MKSRSCSFSAIMQSALRGVVQLLLKFDALDCLVWIERMSHPEISIGRRFQKGDRIVVTVVFRVSSDVASYRRKSMRVTLIYVKPWFEGWWGVESITTSQKSFLAKFCPENGGLEEVTGVLPWERTSW